MSLLLWYCTVPGQDQVVGRGLCLHHVPEWSAGLGSWDRAWCRTQGDQVGWGPAGIRGSSCAEQAVWSAWCLLPLGVHQVPQSRGSGRLLARGLWGPLVLQGDSRLSPASGAGPCSVSKGLASLSFLIATSLSVSTSSSTLGPPWAPVFPAALCAAPLHRQTKRSPHGASGSPREAGPGARGQGRTCVLTSLEPRGSVACSSTASTWHLCPQEDRPGSTDGLCPPLLS